MYVYIHLFVLALFLSALPLAMQQRVIGEVGYKLSDWPREAKNEMVHWIKELEIATAIMFGCIMAVSEIGRIASWFESGKVALPHVHGYGQLQMHSSVQKWIRRLLNAWKKYFCCFQLNNFDEKVSRKKILYTSFCTRTKKYQNYSILNTFIFAFREIITIVKIQWNLLNY